MGNGFAVFAFVGPVIHVEKKGTNKIIHDTRMKSEFFRFSVRFEVAMEGVLEGNCNVEKKSHALQLMRSCTPPIFWDAGCRCAYSSTLSGKEVGSILTSFPVFAFVQLVLLFRIRHKNDIQRWPRRR